MGYCISQCKTKFNIPKKNHSACLQAIKALVGKETIKDSSGKHFKWVNQGFGGKQDLAEILEEWRWTPEFSGNGDIVNIEFEGEKYGDCLLMFNAIAPFVEKGSYIRMRGEDGAIWEWRFDGKICEEVQKGNPCYD